MRVFAVGLVALVGCGTSTPIQGTDSGADSSTQDGSAITDASSEEAQANDGSAATPCKRGVAMNNTPSAAFTGITWWYDWSLIGAASSFEFVPMVWGTSTLNSPLPPGAKFLLGFNEPNFKAQSNLTPTQAATAWPTIAAKAKAAGIPIVSPAVNFCGSSTNTAGCSDPTITDPYTWLKDFFAACAGCEVDAIAIHWYNCDLPSLKAYIEGNKSLEGFLQFNKPIWLTEFSCDGSHSVADQQTYMQAAVPYLEANANVQRYSWFSANPIPNALLAQTNGTLTTLGQTYVSLPQSCKP